MDEKKQKTYKEILNAYFASRQMRNGIWVLNDADYLEDMAKCCGKNFEARSFLSMGSEAILLLVFDKFLKVCRVLKIPRPDLPEVALRRFIRAARVLVQLESEYFPKVCQLSLTPFFLVLDWTIGDTLRDWVFSDRWYPDALIDIFRELLRAMTLLHNQGIIHRDLRPDNILICKENRIKVIDFGFAKCQESSRLTVIEALGNEFYSSPEQLTHAGDVKSPSTDVFSLAQVFYFGITKLEHKPGDHKPEILIERGLPSKILDWYSASTRFNADERYTNAEIMLRAYNEIFPPPLVTKQEHGDIYDLIDSLILLTGGDQYFAEVFTSKFLSRQQLAKLWKTCSERRAKLCISE